MTKSRRDRRSMKSFSKTYNNPETYKKVKDSRKGTGEKKKRTMNVMESQQQNDGSPVDKSKRQSLNELLEDLHGQCESLYAHYDHLTEDLNKKVHNQQQHKEASSSSAPLSSNSNSDSDSVSDSASDSDSDTHHQEKGHKNRKLGDEIATERLQQELKAAFLEITDLKKKLAARDVKAALESHNRTVSSNSEALEKTIQDLRVESGRLNHEKSELLAQREELIREKREMQQQLEQQLKTLQEQNEEMKLKLEKNAKAISDYQIQIEGLHEKLSKTDVHLRKTEDMSENWVQTENSHETSPSYDAHQRKTEDIPEPRIQIEDLHEKLSTTNANLTRLLEEKVHLEAKLKDRELEVGTLNDHKDELEEQTRMGKNEAIQLREEIGRLHDRVLELETAVQQGDENISKLHRKLEDKENEASSEVMALTTEISNLKEALQTAQTIKDQLEAQIEKEKQETYQHLSCLENENAALKGNSNNQLKRLKELQEVVDQKNEQYEQIKHLVQEKEADLQAAERKIEKLTEDLSMLAALKRQIEDLKIDLETAKNEANAAKENTRTVELQLRLADQKLWSTEQLLNEKGEHHKSEEQKFKEECELLHDTISGLKHTLAANNEAYCKMIIDISKNGNNLLAEMEWVTRKFNEDHEKFSNRISKIAREIQIVKHRAGANNTEKGQLKEELSNVTKQLQNERRQGLMLREEICQLGEGKREAIRQLCLWCDNLQSHYDELKSIASRSKLQRQQNR